MKTAHVFPSRLVIESPPILRETLAGLASLSYHDVRGFVGQHFALAVVSALWAGIIFHIVKNKYFHPLSKFPGPYWAGVSNLYCSLMILTGKSEKMELVYHKKYGMCP